MTYQLSTTRASRKQRRVINIHQNSWEEAYVSFRDNSRRSLKSLSDLTNIEVVQDNILRPRPPLVRYGTQHTLPVIGRGKIRHAGTRSLLWMCNDSGTGKLYKQTDGGAITSLGGSYDDEAWAMSVQSKGKAYIFNGVDNLSYVDLSDDSVNTYTELTTPTMTSATYAGTAGSTTYYYRVTANNEVGESIGSVAVTAVNCKNRDGWILNTDKITLLWVVKANATSYTVYVGTRADDTYELYTIDGNASTGFVDLGDITPNPFKPCPEGNSTKGEIFSWMYVDSKNSQIFGLASGNKVFYSAPGTGDFSPYNGGGWFTIDEDGDSTLNFIDGFRTGKGDPVVTTSAREAAGKGKLFHSASQNLTVGDQTITYFDTVEANGQAGTYAPRATIKARDSLDYPTGSGFNSTGTSQNIVNILTNRSIAQAITPNDVDKITVSALSKAVGMEHQDREFFCLPVGSSENNEIWVRDLSRKGAWTLRWPVAAKDMWLYEDSDGNTHHCVLVNNVILEFTRAGAQTHTDDGVAWNSRIAFESLVWDEDGIILGKIRNMYFKLLFPKGTVLANATGLTRRGAETAVGSDTFTVTTTPTGYDMWVYDEYQYDVDPGVVNTYGKSIAILKIRPKGLLAELSWEVLGSTPGTDYILSAVNTRGNALDELIMKTT